MTIGLKPHLSPWRQLRREDFERSTMKTVYIPDEIHAKLKVIAVKRGDKLKDIALIVVKAGLKALESK